MIRMYSIFLLFAVTMTLSAGETYEIDNTHSFVNFKVEHNSVGAAWGRFNRFEGSMKQDGDQLKSVHFTIDPTSIDSGNSKRDAHLKKSDFFNVNEFPKITFNSTKISKKGDKVRVTGDLTMVGMTKPVTFELSLKGPVDGRNDSKVRGYHGHAEIIRSQFNMKYGLPGLGDKITVMVSLEAISN